MANLEDAIAYLLREYPFKEELSNARVTKMLYLADWHNHIRGKPAVTSIDWYFDNYGPFVWDVRNAVRNSNNMEIEATLNYYGTPKDQFVLKNKNYHPAISEDDKAALDHVILETKSLTWPSFIKLVYSTYPISSSERYTKLNLTAKAREYNSLRNQ
jgi:hypothetical protein